MADKTTYLTFYIVLADEALVNEWNAANPQGLAYAPLIAAEQFGAPYQGYVAGTGTDGLAAPFSYSNVAKYTLEDSREYPYPLYVSSFIGQEWRLLGIRRDHDRRIGGSGSSSTKPPLSPTTGGGDGGPVAATTKRRWLEGFETPARSPGQAASGLHGSYCTTDASRHVGGRGLAIRRVYERYFEYTTELLVPNVGAGAPTYAQSGWERFYIRVRRLPSTTIQFWRMNGYNAPVERPRARDHADGATRALHAGTLERVVPRVHDPVRHPRGLDRPRDPRCVATD